MRQNFVHDSNVRVRSAKYNVPSINKEIENAGYPDVWDSRMDAIIKLKVNLISPRKGGKAEGN